MSFPFYKQYDGMDCGPSCLRMIAKHYGRHYTQQTLNKMCEISRLGVSLLGISNTAEKIGFRSHGVKVNIEQLKKLEFPCVLYWRQYHFVVLYKVKKDRFYLADPAIGLVTVSEQDIVTNWQNDNENSEGIALLLTPTPAFYDEEGEKSNRLSWAFLFRYLTIYRNLIYQLILGLCVGGFLQLLMPFLTQSIVDIGVNTRNLNFIFIILIAQFALVIGRGSVEFIRSWILLHISTRVDISILTDFLIKLLKLPMSFFDTKMTGDIMQRMSDQKNIQMFLTGSALSTMFSMFNLLFFSFVLAYYNSTIFFVFLLSSILYTLWIVLFLRRRRTLNFKSFEVSAKNQSSIVQLIGGIQDIKLNNCEQQKRWEWENIQARLFNFNVKTLALNQYQQGGATIINEGKNILIAFLSAKAVIAGDITLGAMVAIQTIIGQLNSPIEQLLGFVQGFQDAKISVERLNEIHQIEDEESEKEDLLQSLPENKDLHITNVSFRYPGTDDEPVLKNIDMFIPNGKTTAIVGMSGSGKTTLLKLLLRFYKPQMGAIKVDDQNLNRISFRTWRENCGVVMQDGFIFSESIEKNIAVGEEIPDKLKLSKAIKIANIQDFIDSQPLGLGTKIGAAGNGISQGQRQRILIARAVYKNPCYLFFDEATNALDANNERVILNNLLDFFSGRTVVVVAHRLSTVSNADNIILLDKGKIIEQGSHHELTALKGEYFKLVKNQLELGI